MGAAGDETHNIKSEVSLLFGAKHNLKTRSKTDLFFCGSQVPPLKHIVDFTLLVFVPMRHKDYLPFNTLHFPPFKNV